MFQLTPESNSKEESALVVIADSEILTKSSKL